MVEVVGADRPKVWSVAWRYFFGLLVGWALYFAFITRADVPMPEGFPWGFIASMLIWALGTVLLLAGLPALLVLATMPRFEWRIRLRGTITGTLLAMLPASLAVLLVYRLPGLPLTLESHEVGTYLQQYPTVLPTVLGYAALVTGLFVAGFRFATRRG